MPPEIGFSAKRSKEVPTAFCDSMISFYLTLVRKFLFEIKVFCVFFLKRKPIDRSRIFIKRFLSFYFRFWEPHQVSVPSHLRVLDQYYYLQRRMLRLNSFDSISFNLDQARVFGISRYGWKPYLFFRYPPGRRKFCALPSPTLYLHWRKGFYCAKHPICFIDHNDASRNTCSIKQGWRQSNDRLYKIILDYFFTDQFSAPPRNKTPWGMIQAILPLSWDRRSYAGQTSDHLSYLSRA